MSEQERQWGVRANTRDVKRRCEEDRHMRRRDTQEPTEGMGQRQKLNVWRSLMSLQSLSTVPLGPERREDQCMYVGASVCVSTSETLGCA